VRNALAIGHREERARGGARATAPPGDIDICTSTHTGFLLLEVQTVE